MDEEWTGPLGDLVKMVGSASQVDSVSGWPTYERRERWAAGVFPLGVRMAGPRPGRPTLTLVTRGRRVLLAWASSEPLGEPADVAAHLEYLVLRAAREQGVLPGALALESSTLVRLLCDRFRPREVQVMLGDGRLWETALDVHMKLLGRDMPQSARTRSWYDWGLPGPDIARFHEVVAAVHREAPWEVLGDSVRLDVDLAGGGGRWIFSTRRSERYGRHLEVFGPTEPEEVSWQADRANIRLRFYRRDQVPAFLRDEVAREGWMLAGRDAYPVIAVSGTPAYGLCRPVMARATRAFDAVVSFVRANRRLLEGRVDGRPIDWSDPAKDWTVSWTPRARLRWPVPIDLEPSLAQGPAADARAALSAPHTERLECEELAVADRYRRYLAPLGPGAREARRRHAHARWFIRFLAYRGVPVRAVSELDLRLYVYHAFIMEHATEGREGDLLPSLEHFFRYLASEEGLFCPWARAILDDEEAFALRLDQAPLTAPPGDRDVRWIEELLDDLHERAMLPPLRPGAWASRLLRDPLRRASGREISWTLLRDELIERGIREPRRLRSMLLQRMEEEGATVAAPPSSPTAS